MKALVSVTISLLLLPLSIFAAMECKEGEDYAVLTQTANLPEQPQDNIIVTEFFSFDCPACDQLEPTLTKWQEKIPTNVEFTKVPVIFAPQWRHSAIAYYIAESLGKEKELSPKIFDAIHRQNKRFTNEQTITDFFIAQAVVDPKVANNPAFINSPTIAAKLKQAEELRDLYQVAQVPTLIVAGKYRTDPSMAGSYNKMLAIVDCLIAKEQNTAE